LWIAPNRCFGETIYVLSEKKLKLLRVYLTLTV